MAHTGRFSPLNPHKYDGDPTNIIFRSGWERKFMLMLDTNSAIIEWASEELKIPYRSPLDKRRHFYYPDFLFTAQQKDGSTGIYLVEIKPWKQTLPPTRKTKDGKKRSGKKFIREVSTYAVNEAKFNAAQALCKKNGWQWQILTEKNINFI